MRKFIVSLVVVLLVPAAFAASASSANTNNVTATVANQCRISTFDLLFGAYDPVVANPTGTPLDSAQANVDVFCTKGTDPTSITMAGTYGASGTGLKMLNSANTDTLDYSLFTDSTRSTAWTSVNPDASTSHGTALKVSGSAIVVYGRVTGGQNVSAGDYTGTLQATVNF